MDKLQSFEHNGWRFESVQRPHVHIEGAPVGMVQLIFAKGNSRFAMPVDERWIDGDDEAFERVLIGARLMLDRR